MAILNFRSFLSTINPFRSGGAIAAWNILTDSTTGAPVGVQNRNANGPDGLWAPIDVTAAQITSPSAAMLADLNATYRLNVAPYTRYMSNGAELSALTDAGYDVIQADGVFANFVAWSPLTISAPAGITVLGTLNVRTLSA